MTDTDIELSRKELLLLEAERAPDWLLAILVKLANRSAEFRMGITLCVHGLIVSGQLVGGQRYSAELAEILRTQATGDGSGLAAALDVVGDWYGEDATDFEHVDEASDEDEPEVDKTTAPTFIHLSGARIWQSGQQMAQDPMPWRGRLAVVDGFIIGELSGQPVDAYSA